jgi:hypothetical protein
VGQKLGPYFPADLRQVIPCTTSQESLGVDALSSSFFWQTPARWNWLYKAQIDHNFKRFSICANARF